MIAGVEASIVAGEILALIKKLKEEYGGNVKAIEALEKVEAEARQIKEAGDGGFY